MYSQPGIVIAGHLYWFTLMSPDVIYVAAQKLWWFLVVLGVLVTFHEFGHFIVARWAGVKVLKFSLGFGPKLFSRQVGDTEYLVSLIPLGGYVKMFGEDTGDTISVQEQQVSFVHKSLFKRTLIVAAGPGFNFLLSYLIFSVWLATGAPLPIPTFEELSPTIDAIRTGSPASAAGFEVGDKITRINDQEIATQNDVFAMIAESKGQPLTFEVVRGGHHKTLVVTPEVFDQQQTEEPVYVIGIEEAPPTVTSVIPDMPAMAGGLKEEDRILSINSVPIHTWSEMTKIVRENPNQALEFQVDRHGALVTLTITPEGHESTEDDLPVKIGKIGITGPGRSVVRSDHPLTALIHGIQATWGWSELTVVGIYKMFTGEISTKHLGGPIMIASASGKAAESGFSDVAFLVAILSINLGILNLLPIPILDGGHLFFFACEAILRRPLGERQREFAQQVGLVLLFGIMIFAFFNDIQRLLQ